VKKSTIVSKSAGVAGRSAAMNRAVKKTFLAAEFLADLSVEKIDDYFQIEMLLKDPGKKARDFTWSARIFPPVPDGPDQFWKPLAEIK